MLKNIFLEVKKKFETAIGVLRKEKITIDPDDPAAVEQYEKVMKTVREKIPPNFMISTNLTDSCRASIGGVLLFLVGGLGLVIFEVDLLGLS
ncbi:similar to MALE GAMETOPHYTE DEFECTIVE 1 [Actinidia rufa]|uniref:Similar to MALE GAMETOPHYTE DEFECTIVE 1 n=1 Tax=Actinidia rufa TaxID=165716 RepID=A0A7J0EME2_9ERIC|nr:similar to MALE GAMETOPHYTE DEFECTIVE 1 [Actinidia rufa]